MPRPAEGRFPVANSLFVLCAVAHAYLLAFLVRNVYGKEEAICEAILLLLEVGILHDNVMLAFGAYLKGWGWFLPASRVRFIMHGTIIPACFLVLLHLLHRWVPLSFVVFAASYSIVALFMVFALHRSLVETLVLKSDRGVTRFTTKQFNLGQILPAVVLTLAQIALGVVEYHAQGTLVLASGGTFMP